MSLPRRALLAAVLPCAAPARAQPAWPDRPLRLVVPFPPGGNIDSLSRLLAIQLGTRLAQPVVVENRPGAGGALGAEHVANSRPDGHTLMMGSNGSMIGNLLTQANLPYDPVRQFRPVGLCAVLPMVVAVRADHPARTVQELVAMARAAPGRVSCGTAGIGSSNHLALALFDAAAQAGIVHVPYRGSGPMVPDLLAGNVTCVMEQVSGALPLVREGRLRLLAVTGAARSRQLPDVPTLVEAGYAGAVMVSWNGLVVPTGVPAPVTERLSALLPECLDAPALRDQMEGLGVEIARPPQTTPAWFGEFLRQDLETTRRAVQLAGLKPE